MSKLDRLDFNGIYLNGNVLPNRNLRAHINPLQACTHSF
jgi:hypothetical protein